jgi:hypothetical protein
MRTYLMLSLLLLTAASPILGLRPAEASPGPNVNVSINGYLPAPPGVTVRVDAGRPYYIENERRVYIERERPRHKHRHHKEKRRYEEQARDHGHEGRRKH